MSSATQSQHCQPQGGRGGGGAASCVAPQRPLLACGGGVDIPVEPARRAIVATILAREPREDLRVGAERGRRTPDEFGGLGLGAQREVLAAKHMHGACMSLGAPREVLLDARSVQVAHTQRTCVRMHMRMHMRMRTRSTHAAHTQRTRSARAYAHAW